MDEELQYGYPADESQIDYELIQEQYKVNRTFKVRVIILALAFMTFFFLYSLTLIQLLLYTSIIIGACEGVTLIGFKKVNSHFLSINAYETYIDLAYYSSNREYCSYAHLLYNDIYSMNLGGKNYDKVTLSFVNKSGKSYIKNIYKDGSEKLSVNVKTENFYSCDLNVNSGEQGFFIYYADRLFQTKMSDKKKKKLRNIFGDEEDYYGYDE